MVPDDSHSGRPPVRRSSWSKLPLLKGVLHCDDARLGIEHGAAAIWVSNHGGRQLDRVPAPIDVLTGILDVVDGRAEVYLDGGIRRGPDVAIALALGARAVFAALPFLNALACAGEAGVTHALAILREELLRTMALLGVRSIGDIAASHVTASHEAALEIPRSARGLGHSAPERGA